MNLIEWPYYRRDFLALQAFSENFVSRFWDKVLITDGCWLWTAAHEGDGYGQFYASPIHDPKKIYAHIAAWILHHGPLPEGMRVCHHCDNPPCVRPDHLFIGTQRENLQDSIRKGRNNIGERHPFHKLCSDDILDIRESFTKGLATRIELANKFGIHKSYVDTVIRRKAWTHI